MINCKEHWVKKQFGFPYDRFKYLNKMLIKCFHLLSWWIFAGLPDRIAMGFLPEAHHAMSGTLRHEYSQQCRAKIFPPNRAKDSYNSTTYYTHSYKNRYTSLMTLNVKNVCFYGCTVYTPTEILLHSRPSAPPISNFYRSFYVLIRENGMIETICWWLRMVILVHPCTP